MIKLYRRTKGQWVEVEEDFVKEDSFKEKVLKTLITEGEMQLIVSGIIEKVQYILKDSKQIAIYLEE